MKRLIKFSLIVLAAMIFSPATRANNLSIRNITLLDQDTTQKQLSITFDLAWDNSWRNDTNHDAAWVFLKFRAAGSNFWQHAYLSDAAGDHAAPNGIIELGASTINDQERIVGAFVASGNAQTGSVHYSRASLRWDYGISGYTWTQDDPVEVSVHAIEMVYVAEGPFYLGSGGTGSGSFTDGAWLSGTSIPFRVTSEAAVIITNAPGALWGRPAATYTSTIGPAGELPAAFPTGFHSFYCMKYPVTEQQYAAFLNRLTGEQAARRYPGMVGTYRHALYYASDHYTTEAPDRACGYLGWTDGTAYLDWAGLRPITETEYEKACRGPAAPVPNECAWGTPDFVLQTDFDGVDGSGVETALPTNANTVKASTLGGLTRAGIFATPSADRVASGASYWGIMELSSHPALLMVSVGLIRGREFKGSHGDGMLSASGYATNSDWPGYNTSNKEVTGTGGFGFRLAHWNNPNSLFPQVSHRDAAIQNTSSRLAHHGVRGVRTAP